MIAVHSDLEPGVELSSVRLETYELDGRTPISAAKTLRIAADLAGKGEVRLPVTEVITKGRLSSCLLWVTGYQKPAHGGPEERVVRYEAKPTFQMGKRLFLQVFLGRACLGQLCASDRTCYAQPGLAAPVGVCGEIASLDDLPEFSSGDELAPILSSPDADGGSGIGGTIADAGTDVHAQHDAPTTGAGEGPALSGGRESRDDCPADDPCTTSSGCGVEVYPDADGDGHGDSTAQAMWVCADEMPAGFAELHDDCDDTCPTCFPGKHGELECDGLDDDCDGEIDEGLLSEFALDCDGSLHPDALLSAPACTRPASLPENCSEGAWWSQGRYVEDCDDTNFDIRPDALELCGDGIDNDCDGRTDPDDCTDPGDNSSAL